jgi:hypothetical protein
LLEELTKFRNTNKLEIENLILKQQVLRKQEQTKLLDGNLQILGKRFDKEATQLRRDLENEKKDKLIVMNQMVKSMETEKTTRIKAYSFLAPDGQDGLDIHEVRRQDRLAQNQDDVGTILTLRWSSTKESCSRRSQFTKKSRTRG